ncbi:MAG TPA: TadE/TadG family type IV pilus assembly protein [Rhizomicrobium sp.]|nr:TadE/TadG family type IV pilus assembly protein [Rhizomicrobium sp.]
MRWASDYEINRARALLTRVKLRRILNNDSGASAAEFAIVVPFLLLAFMTVVKLGIVINNYIEINSGTRASSRVLSIGRGSATPYTDSLAAFRSMAPNLSLTPTMTVNGTACASDGACQTQLNTASGLPVVVSASLSCNLTIMGFNYAPGCTLSSQTTERAE